VLDERRERLFADAIATPAPRGRAIRIIDDELAAARDADDGDEVAAGVRLRRRQIARAAERDDQPAAPEHAPHPRAVESRMHARAEVQRRRHAHDAGRRRGAIDLPVVEAIERIDERGVGQARAQMKAARDHGHVRRAAAALTVIAGRTAGGKALADHRRQRQRLRGDEPCNDRGQRHGGDNSKNEAA